MCLSEMEKGDIEHNILTKATKNNRLTKATINVSKLFIWLHYTVGFLVISV